MLHYQEKPIYHESYQFALSIIRFASSSLPRTAATNIISGQLIRSSLSVSANLAEGSLAASHKEYINFIRISLKSAIETNHWLHVLIDLGYDHSFVPQSEKIIKILYAILNALLKNS